MSSFACSSIRLLSTFFEQGVSGDVRCGELGLELVALEDDVLSLELDNAFKVKLQRFFFIGQKRACVDAFAYKRYGLRSM